MSYTRDKYSSCTYRQELGQSVGAAGYMFEPSKFYVNSQCRQDLGAPGNDVSLTYKNLVGVESDLKGYTRVTSRCDSAKYRPRPEPFFGPGQSNVPVCRNFIDHPKPQISSGLPPLPGGLFSMSGVSPCGSSGAGRYPPQMNPINW